jgi:hypothetical protein
VEADRPDVQEDPLAYFRWFYAVDPVEVTEPQPDLVEARWHPDMVMIQASDMVGTAGEFHGYEGLAQLQVELRESFERIDWNPVDVTETDDGRFLVTLEPDAHSHQGVVISPRTLGGWLGHLMTLHEDGRVVRLETFLDEQKARAAAGLD